MIPHFLHIGKRKHYIDNKTFDNAGNGNDQIRALGPIYTADAVIDEEEEEDGGDDGDDEGEEGGAEAEEEMGRGGRRHRAWKGTHEQG